MLRHRDPARLPKGSARRIGTRYHLMLREKRRRQAAGVCPQLSDTAGVRGVSEALGAQGRLRERLLPAASGSQPSRGRGQHRAPAETPQGTPMEAPPAQPHAKGTFLSTSEIPSLQEKNLPQPHGSPNPRSNRPEQLL